MVHLNYSDVQHIYKKSIIVFNWFYISICILWDVLQRNVFMVDGAGRTIFFLSILAVSINTNTILNFFFSRKRGACLLLLGLFAWSLLNSLMKGIPSDSNNFAFFTVNYVHPLSFLFVTTCSLWKHRTRTLIVILFSLLTYVILGSLFIGTAADEYGRFMNKELGNLLPLYTMPLVFVSAMLYRENILKGMLFPILIMAFVVTILCATRKSLVAIIIIMIGVWVSMRSHDQLAKYMVALLALVLLSVGCVYLVNNTVIGERISSTFNSNVKYSIAGNQRVDIMLNVLLGDRSLLYFFGLKLFQEHPITGIGLCHFKQMSGLIFRMHSEYMVQLCENGIIGFALLISYYYVIIHRLVTIRVRRRPHAIVFAGFIALLLVGLWSWIYCVNFAMIIYAIVLTTIYPTKKVVIAKNGTE